MKICEKVKSAIQPLFLGEEVELLDVQFVKKPDGNHLIIYIDAQRPILHSDCERISNLISPVLEKLNPTDDQKYYLDVSSYGLDKPLITVKQLNKYLNKKVVIKLYSKIDGQKEFVGKLLYFDDIIIKIETDSKENSFNQTQIANILPFIKF